MVLVKGQTGKISENGRGRGRSQRGRTKVSFRVYRYSMREIVKKRTLLTQRSRYLWQPRSAPPRTTLAPLCRPNDWIAIPRKRVSIQCNAIFLSGREVVTRSRARFETARFCFPAPSIVPFAILPLHFRRLPQAKFTLPRRNEVLVPITVRKHIRRRPFLNFNSGQVFG